jgi:hypothetical protein
MKTDLLVVYLTTLYQVKRPFVRSEIKKEKIRGRSGQDINAVMKLERTRKTVQSSVRITGDLNQVASNVAAW